MRWQVICDEADSAVKLDEYKVHMPQTPISIKKHSQCCGFTALQAGCEPTQCIKVKYMGVKVSNYSIRQENTVVE